MALPGTKAPKDRFSSLDALALARELRALDHPRVDKAFDAGPEEWALSLKLRSGGRADLVLHPGLFGAISPVPVGHGEAPGPLARDLRRLLAGTLVASVGDPGGDRVLDVEFARSDGTTGLRLVVEFFGRGNLVVVRDGMIVAVAHPRSWAHRTLRVGQPYVPAPPSVNPWTTSSAQLEVTLLGSATNRVSTLAARAGYSGAIAEELLLRAGIEGGAPAREEAGATAVAIRGAADALLAEIGELPAGFLYRAADRIVDVTPFPSLRRRAEGGIVEERQDRFGPAVLAFFAQPTLAPAPPSTGKSAADALRRQRERQQEAVDRLSTEAAQLRAQADRIFEQYDAAEAARHRAAEGAAEPGTVKVRLGDLEVPIDVTRPVEASARELYEASKRTRSKLDGARSALASTDADLARAEALPEESEAPARAVTKRPAGKPLWFEKFRWFVSSEGILVIAGRDATTNDLVVRRYLREGDRYVHADLHGAASVVVKVSGGTGPTEPGEATLLEAGQFAVAHSKAWRAGLAASDAYWVLPDQVSKTAASGEFVARGAWVIHGTKHPLRDLPLELAVGTMDYEGRPFWTVAPAASLRARGTTRALLSPDDERTRSDRERELVRELGIDADLLPRLLPAGGFRIARA